MALSSIGLVAAAAAEAHEGDAAVFRISEDDLEHDQFWTDRESNQVEGRFAYVTPEGRELETRYVQLNIELADCVVRVRRIHFLFS